MSWVRAAETESTCPRPTVVVTEAALGIVEKGTVVLDHGAWQGRRALSLLPDLHVCVLRAEQIVPGVPEAMSLLDSIRPQTWVSGPSATSDIELSRVEGGPRSPQVACNARRRSGRSECVGELGLPQRRSNVLLLRPNNKRNKWSRECHTTQSIRAR